MSKQITVKYFQGSVFAKEPVKATDGAAGYDLFAAELIPLFLIVVKLFVSI